MPKKIDKKFVEETTGISGFASSGSGISGLEKNPEFLGSRKYQIYNEMRLQDAQIAGLLSLIRSSVTTSDRQIVGGSDEQRNWIEPLIMGDIDAHLSRASLHLLYGNYVFEQILGVDKSGRIYEQSLEPRQPWTISGWVRDETGALSVIQQTGGANAHIPAGRAVLYINDAEGNNYEGVSIFRPCYGPYMTKRKYMHYELVSAQKAAVGNIWVKMASSDKTQRDAAILLAQGYLSAGDSYIVTTPRDGIGDIAFLRDTGGVFDASTRLPYYDQQMSKALLAQFIDFGSKDKSGSYALVSEHIEIYYEMVARFLRHMAGVINEQRIRRLIDYNWRGTEDYPQVVFSGWDKPDAAALAQAVALLAPAGVVFSDAEKIDIKTAIGLKPQQKESTGTGGATTSLHAHANIDCTHQLVDNAKPGWQPRRPLTLAEQRVDFADIINTLDAGVAELAKKIATANLELTDAYTDMLLPAIAAGDIASIAALAPPEKIVEGLKTALVVAARRKLAAGRESVRAEAGKAGIKLSVDLAAARPDPAAIEAVVVAFAEDEAEKFVSATTFAAKRGARSAIVSGITGAAAGKMINDAIEWSVGRMPDNIANGLINTAYINGRDAEAQNLIDAGKIRNSYYSAVMDNSTCGVCAGSDGAEVVDGQPPAPNPSCEGADNCRCVHVYDFT